MLGFLLGPSLPRMSHSLPPQSGLEPYVSCVFDIHFSPSVHDRLARCRPVNAIVDGGGHISAARARQAYGVESAQNTPTPNKKNKNAPLMVKEMDWVMTLPSTAKWQEGLSTTADCVLMFIGDFCLIHDVHYYMAWFRFYLGATEALFLIPRRCTRANPFLTVIPGCFCPAFVRRSIMMYQPTFTWQSRRSFMINSVSYQKR